MKNLYCIIFLLASFTGRAQVIADPATGQMDITNLSGISLNANFIAPGTVVTLKVPVYNLNQLVGLPAGTCKFIIDPGNNMILDPSFNLATAPLSNYFSWSYTVTGTLVQITGNLVAPLPEDFAGMATFNMKGTVPGTSIISSDFLVTNHNTNTVLSDEDPNNNTATLEYTITSQTAPVPVTFTKVALTKKGCTVQVSFLTEKEINVNRYEIELSKDGIHYKKAGETEAKNTTGYTYNFQLTDSITAPNIFVRIKAVDNDGSYRYSETRQVSGICEEKDKKPLLNIYPNPITDRNTNMVINTRDNRLFNGRYKLTLIDMGGRIIETKECKINNATQFSYDPGKISAGIYQLQMQNTAGSTSSSVTKFVKM